MSDRKFDLLQGEVAQRFAKELTRNLVEYNRSVGPPEGWHELVISVEADDATVLGGLAGYTLWRWLFIGHVRAASCSARSALAGKSLARFKNKGLLFIVDRPSFEMLKKRLAKQKHAPMCRHVPRPNWCLVGYNGSKLRNAILCDVSDFDRLR